MTKIITKNNESRLTRYWRPMIAWQYFVVLTYDFFCAPVIYNYISLNGDNVVQWNPITLQAGGMYHIAMATIVGIYTWSRGMEKMEMMKNGIIPSSPADSIEQTEIK